MSHALVILFNNINLFLLLVQHGPRESEGSPDVLQAIGGGLLHVLVLRPDQLEQVGDHLGGKITCIA